jgi:hypothetical protein
VYSPCLALYREGPLPLNVVVDISIGMFEALAHLHGLGYAHFNVKMAKILLKQKGLSLSPVLAGFGLAKQATDNGDFCLVGAR